MKQRRLSLILYILPGIAILLFGYWFALHQAARKDREIRNQMKDQAIGLAASLDPELLKALTFTESDTGSPVYNRIRNQMISYGRIISQRGIYSMILRDGQLLFGPENYPEGDPMGSGPPGTVYQEPSPEDFLIFKTGQPFVVGPISDEYGEFISTSAPVTDPVSGEVLMVVGIDILSSTWRAELRRTYVFPGLVTALLLFLYIVGVLLYRSGSKRVFGRRLPQSILDGGIILSTGMLITLVLAQLIYQNRTGERSLVFTQHGELHYRQIRAVMSDIRNELQTLGRFVENSREITREEFISFSKDLAANPGIEFFALSTVLKDDSALIEVSYSQTPEWWFPTPGHLDSNIARLYHQGIAEKLPQAIRMNPFGDNSSGQRIMILVYPLRTVPSDCPGNWVEPKGNMILGQIDLNPIMKGLSTIGNYGTPLITTELWEIYPNSKPTLILGTNNPNDETNQYNAGWFNPYTQFTHISPLFVNGRSFAVVSHAGHLFLQEYPIYSTWLTLLAGILLFGGLALFVGLLRNRQDALEQAVAQRTRELQDKVEELGLSRDKAEAGDRLKTAFIRNISHEIRTPLNGILGFSELLVTDELTSVERRTYANLIRSSSNRLLSTITDYMDISRIESGTVELYPSVFPVRDLLQSLYETFEHQSREKAVTLKLVMPEQKNRELIRTDKDLLFGIFSHLLDNAFKFTREGSITFGYRLSDQMIQFEVSDTGIGMTPEAVGKSTEPFFQEEISDTRGHEGSGLGLSITRGFIELLGGTLEVTSTKGEGTTVRFSLPEFLEEETQGSAVVHPAPANVAQATILVAEDDPSNLQYILTLLVRTNLTLMTASDGQQAVSLCHTHPEISLVLMDIKMPVLEGLEATRLIKQARPDLPIIAITAYALPGDQKKAIQAGCDDYLSKPFRKSDLLEKISRFVQT